jgi:hypothetical protein
MIAIIAHNRKELSVTIQQMRLSNKIMVYSNEPTHYYKAYTYDEILQNVVFLDPADRQHFEANFLIVSHVYPPPF